MKKTTTNIIKITNVLALALSLIVAIGVPAGYIVLVYEYQATVLKTEAASEAYEASQIISSNPDFWQFEQHRLSEFLSRRTPGQPYETRRIVNAENRIVAESVHEEVLPPLMTRTHDLYDSGKKTARIEITRSLRPALSVTFLLMVIGLFLGIGMLIFLRKFPLRALSQALQSLQESEGKFRAMASTAADGIIVMDSRGLITYWNSAAEKIFGYSSPEAHGRELHMLIAPERYRDDYKKGFKKFERSGDGPAIGNTLEFMALRKDGTEFPIEVSTSTIPAADQWHAVGIVRDISDRKKTEQELLKLEKLESLGVLAGGLAHDFNNLLTVMMGNISLAMLDTNPEDGLYSRLTNLGEAVVRAQDLTRQLLTFAKGGAPIKNTVLLQAIIEEACRFSLSGSNVNCSFVFSPDLKPADVDAGQIGQVMHNLVLNAVQAMPKSGKIEVRASNTTIGPQDGFPLVSGPYLRISVRDEGTGMPQRDLSKIFDPYFTTKEKGSGLGLATCYSIIKRHGGHITVHSTRGEGSVFTFFIPASLREPSADEPPEHVLAKGKGKVLVMDDEKAFRMVVGEILQAIGYEYELAKDGAEAIDLYQAAMLSGRPFDAAIMDLTVPGGMGGKEAVKRLIEIDPKVKAIVASGYSNDPVMADFKAHGFVGVIEKPFDLRSLNRVLQAVLNVNSPS